MDNDIFHQMNKTTIQIPFNHIITNQTLSYFIINQKLTHTQYLYTQFDKLWTSSVKQNNKQYFQFIIDIVQQNIYNWIHNFWNNDNIHLSFTNDFQIVFHINDTQKNNNNQNFIRNTFRDLPIYSIFYFPKYKYELLYNHQFPLQQFIDIQNWFQDMIHKFGKPHLEIVFQNYQHNELIDYRPVYNYQFLKSYHSLNDKINNQSKKTYQQIDTLTQQFQLQIQTLQNKLDDTNTQFKILTQKFDEYIQIHNYKSVDLLDLNFFKKNKFNNNKQIDNNTDLILDDDNHIFNFEEVSKSLIQNEDNSNEIKNNYTEIEDNINQELLFKLKCKMAYDGGGHLIKSVCVSIQNLEIKTNYNVSFITFLKNIKLNSNINIFNHYQPITMICQDIQQIDDNYQGDLYIFLIKPNGTPYSIGSWNQINLNMEFDRIKIYNQIIQYFIQSLNFLEKSLTKNALWAYQKNKYKIHNYQQNNEDIIEIYQRF